MIGFAVIPFGPNMTLNVFGITIKPFVISDINIGILYILAFASIGAYGIILGGWSSNSKYSLLGGLRSAAQVISYELNVGLAHRRRADVGGLPQSRANHGSAGGRILALVHLGRDARTDSFLSIPKFSPLSSSSSLPWRKPTVSRSICRKRKANWWLDFFTEYSGMRFAFFVIAEYANMILVSCVAAALFLGGWNAPYPGTISRVHRFGTVGLGGTRRLVCGESLFFPLSVLLDTRDVAPTALRSIDAVWLESHVADRTGEHRHHVITLVFLSAGEADVVSADQLSALDSNLDETKADR